MAAAVKPPGPADDRIPCPLCGGLIHPIAGRCKHCKGDISATRSARPAAAAALPSLQASGQAQPYLGHANGHAAYAAVAHPANAHMPVKIAVRAPEVRDDRAASIVTARPSGGAAILPPRPTGRMETTARPTTWKSWPVVVIGVAVAAIILAVILMVWPSDQPTRADVKTLAPPPAPERMDTNPSPSTGTGPSTSNDPPPADPWKTDPGAAPDPAPSQPSTPSVPDIDQIDPPNLSDPFRGGAQTVFDMSNAMRQHGCDRYTACGQSDDMVKAACDLANMALPKAKPPTCQAAQRCLAKIDTLPCDDVDPDAITLGLFQSVPDCLEAMTRC